MTHALPVRVTVSMCRECRQLSLWVRYGLVWPDTGGIPPPHEIIAEDRHEKGTVKKCRPGIAALLQLCVQKFCVVLELPADDFNSSIGILVDRGLSPKVQLALGATPLIANDALRPGLRDLANDIATATALLNLSNVIAQALLDA